MQENVSLTASIVSESLLRFEEAQGKVSGESTLINDKDIVREGKKGGRRRRRYIVQ